MKRIAAPKAAVSGEVIQFGIADVGFKCMVSWYVQGHGQCL